MIPAVLYFLFFCSGVSGLIYQVVWVREFGNVFGNTVYSTSLVIAIFMLGLGAGSYLVGVWADRRYERAPESLLQAYGYVELIIAALGLGVSLLLPGISALAASLSSYQQDQTGWNVVSPASYLARSAIAIVLLTPITLLMGGTLTLLIRHLVRRDVEVMGGWTIAVVYGVNTAEAAAGAFLTDFALVPMAGLRFTQLVAVALNVVAGAGALLLAKRVSSRLKPAPTSESVGGSCYVGAGFSRLKWTALALALTGFAAMGMEILWVRHFTLILGGFRAVFSLLITLVLVGIGVGSLLGGFIDRRTSRPAHALMVMQALFVASALLGLASGNLVDAREEARVLGASLPSITGWERALMELWYNARPILIEVGLPALFMGCSFPLANALVQTAEHAVGRRAGLLYLANTAGAVAGSIAAGYVLLPALGMQQSATILTLAGGAAIVPLCLVADRAARRASVTSAGAVLLAAGALVVWSLLPSDYLLQRSMPVLRVREQLIAVSEGVSEIIAVTETPSLGRGLITNGHPMSSTAPLDQRYMRALAHIPLLSMEQPERVLVIGFGVGNTTHAASLHPSVRRIEVADLSRHVLEHAGYFSDANRGILDDPRVAVYVNDGRQHLQMQPESVYDLITLEPPPIAQAGVAALYSREFYALARTRLKAGGYLSQWLPAYQVPAETTLAMVRAFLDVFPQSVLLSGTQAELLLVGTTAPAIEVDPDRLAAALQRAPDAHADLRRLDLGSVPEIVGAFIGSAATLERATRGSSPATDDHPLQEYGVRSVIGSGLMGVPASLFNLRELDAWCPRCFDGDRLVPSVAALNTYLLLLEEAYNAPAADVLAAASANGGQRRMLGSAYLGAVVPDSSEVQRILADEALTARGKPDEAVAHLRRAVQLDPRNSLAQYDLGELLLERQQFAEAAEHLRAALGAMSMFAGLHNDLGVALASMGDVRSATEHFMQAVELEPDFAEARNNLEAALRLLR